MDDASDTRQIPAILRWGAAGVAVALGLGALAILVVTIVAIVRLAG